jgi:F0F1-type ATP synthase assembly protein I
MPEEEKPRSSSMKTALQWADVTNMGVAMVLCIVMGLTLGIYLHNYFGFSPYWTLLFLFGGILAGFRIMYKTFVKFFKHEGKES